MRVGVDEQATAQVDWVSVAIIVTEKVWVCV
jgi:hypothetical protein